MPVPVRAAGGAGERNWRLLRGMWSRDTGREWDVGAHVWDTGGLHLLSFLWILVTQRAVRSPHGPGWELFPVLGRGRGW